MITCKTRLENNFIYVDSWNNEGEKKLKLNIYELESNLKLVDYDFIIIDYIQIWSTINFNCEDYPFLNAFKIVITNLDNKEKEYDDILLIKPYALKKFIDIDNALTKNVSEVLILNYFDNFHLFDKYNIKFNNIKVLIDLGSSIGSFTSYVLKKNPELKSICVELNPIFHKICSDTFIDYPNITAINAAIYKKSNEIVKINSRSENLCDLGNTIIGNLYGDQENIFEASTISIDDIIKQFDLDRISLLKVDIEGYEYELFENLSDDILSKIDEILLEFHPISDLKKRLDLINRLMINGFKFKFLGEEINIYSEYMFTLYFKK
jgi:FkbM family methyltransferase